MKKLSWFLVIALVVVIMTPAFAAPLFPDVPEQHWARDAVADLAAKGILEGYPDGTFKGDRAATRWEMAMALQRFLAKMEAEHATFATKADLEALRALVNNLKDELDALGVRVKNLEENVSALDKRVTELERITFEGDFTTRLVTIGIRNTGSTSAIGTWAPSVGGSAGAFGTINAFGIAWPYPGTNDLQSWRPLTNGVGLTARARLGVKVKVNQDMDAGIRFAAFSSVGDRFIDAYWGISAPYLSNVFTGDAGGIAAQNNVNTPWTKMTFDKFWIEHKPTNTMIIAGAIEKTNFDSFMIANINNPNYSGRDRSRYADMDKSGEKKSRVSSYKYYEGEDGFLPYYGIKVNGKTHFISDMKWETMYTRLPNEDATVQPTLWGFNLEWKLKDQYSIKVNFARASEVTNSATPQAYVPARAPLGYACLVGTGLEWTDPLDKAGTAAAQRPMRGNAGVIGLQGQTMYGLSFNYKFDPSDIRLILAYGGTRYQPSLESTFTANGNHFRGGVGWTNKPNTLDIDVEYISTDPYYDAFQARYPVAAFQGLSLVNFPNFGYYGFGYQLHDSDLYPNNRAGLRFGVEYRFSKGNGRANLRGNFLTQSSASTPQLTTTGFYYGMKPGFIDPIFSNLATTNATAAAVNVNAANAIAETPKGKVNHFGAGVEYKFAPSAFRANVQYDHYDFKRTSGFAAATNIAKWNTVDLRNDVMKIGLGYAFSDKFTLRGGYDYAATKGYHPAFNPLWQNGGTYVVNSTQSVPWLGFDYDIGKNTQWTFDLRLYNQSDKLATNFNGTNNNPESYAGIQLMTQFKVKF